MRSHSRRGGADIRPRPGSRNASVGQESGDDSSFYEPETLKSILSSMSGRAVRIMESVKSHVPYGR
jgi:hypothetical protein